jgi:hypothetical protein
MTPVIRAGCRSGFVALALCLLASCGDEDGGLGPGGPARNFDSGTGFNGDVSVIVPALDGSGDVYVGGNFNQYNGATVNGIARLDRNGARDAGFEVDEGFDSFVNDIEPIDDRSGDIYVAGGFLNFRGNPRAHIVRVNPDGTDGAVDFGSGFNDDVYTLALNEGRGDLYAGGQFTTFRQAAFEMVARVDPDGTSDNVFNTGTGFDHFPGFAVLAVEVARDGTGDIYAGGLFGTFRGNSRNGIVRINPDGSNDGGFDPGTGFNAHVTDIAVADDGTNALYVAGTFNSYQGNDRFGIVRIAADGSEDGAFVTGAGFDDRDVRVVALAGDGSGDIYVGGNFTSYDGAPAPRIARLDSNGSLDAGFVTGSGFDGSVWTIAPAADGSGDVLVGGAFTHYNGVAVGRIVRLNANGTLD